MFGIHHAKSRLGSINILRNISHGSTRVPSRVSTRATPADDRDIFGTLSESGRRKLDVRHADQNLPDDNDGYDKLEFDIEARKNAYYYKYEITKYARQGAPGLRKALELYQEMKAKARLEPSMDNFSPLIYGCAKAGYTKRAFDLYEESQRYSQKPSNSMVTCLINSCAESPFPEYGIERLKWFLPHIKANHGRQLNEPQYNCAIKAFGKLGQLEEASKLVQEMINEGVTPTVDTFNMLLIGCASNRDAGCSIALRVFKRLKMYQFQPTVVTYRLLLRCIRDCGMGSPELIEETLKELPAVTSHNQRLKYQSHVPGHTRQRGRKNDPQFTWMPLLTDIGESIKKAIEEPKSNSDGNLVRINELKKGKHSPVVVVDSTKLEKDLITQSQTATDPMSTELTTHGGNNHAKLPNLLSDDHLDLVMRIRAIKFDGLRDGVDRIMLFGGFFGYLEIMMKDGCRPDSKTFSLILECVKGTPENYLTYFKLAEELKVQRDLLFYDLLIRHICKHGVNMDRLDFALGFLDKMHLDNIRPNISTFESLALGCRSWMMARKLLMDIDKCGFIPSQVLIYHMFKIAIRKTNFEYLNQLMDHCMMNSFHPRKRLVEDLEALRLETGKLILQQEKNPSNHGGVATFDALAIRDYDLFRSKFRQWLERVDLEQEEHPWSQFKVDTSSKRDGFRLYEKHFNAMEQVKKEALDKGRGLGNLAEKAKKIVELQA